jgi:voltage-gated potassium channel Kch
LKSPSQTQNYVNQTQIIDYVAFDLDPNVVIKGYRDGLRVLYGDGCQPLVLLTAGIQSPKAFIITYPEQETRIKAVEKLRQAFPDTPIISRVSGVDQYYELIQSGANNVYIQEREASYSMFTALLSALNVNFEGVQQVDKTISTQSNLAITNENLPIFAIDQLIRRLREQNDKLDRETLKKRKSEKTGWSRDVLTNRINVPDTAYFESFRRSFAASFSGESLSVSNVLDQVSSKFKGVLGSVKIGSDGYSETDLVDYLWLDQGESVNSKPAPISDSPSVNEEFSDQMSIQFVTKKEGMSTTMSEQESMLKILSEASDENKMGVTMCPLPPREENRS